MSKIDLKPASVFDCFAQICAVPHPSKREEKMIDFLTENDLHVGKYYSDW